MTTYLRLHRHADKYNTASFVLTSLAITRLIFYDVLYILFTRHRKYTYQRIDWEEHVQTVEPTLIQDRIALDSKVVESGNNILIGID